MMKMIKWAVLGVVTSLAIMGPCITTIADEVAEMSDASSANSPLYSVVVPKEISFGELKDTNYQLTYPIDIELYQPELGDVYIESPNVIKLTSGDTEISVNSTLRNSGVMDSIEFEAMFWVEPTTVMTQKQGEYTGAIDFQFKFRADEIVSEKKAVNVSGREVGMISNGFTELVNEITSDETYKFTTTANSGLNKEYIKTVVTAMQKYSGENSETLSKISEVVEVRIPITPLGANEELQYNVKNITTDKDLNRLAVRPEVGNYTDGQYFAGIDVIYIYTTDMQEYGIYTGEVAEGVYPPEYEPETDEPTTPPVTGGDSDFTPDIAGNNGNSDGNVSEESDDYVAPDVSGGDGEYTATVSMRRADQIDTLSMCDALFYTKADITLNGDDATVTLYVIDPIPMFVSAGTPLSNVKYMYKSKDYSATTDSSNQAVKYFESASGFISEAGNYYTTKIVSTIPKQAIADSVNGEVKVEAYVNAVMESTQQFYVVFGNMEKGDTSGDADDSDVLNNDLSDTTGGNTLSPNSTTGSADVSGGDGEYTADVSMRRADDINTLSMCNALFYSQADIVLSGDDATVTIYVIDPIPMYADLGTPLLNVKYMYESKNYVASYISTNKEAKYFPTASGFISEAGNYYTSKIVVNIPKQAIADSVNGELMVEGYVNVVMESTQKFYAVFSNITKGSTETVTDTSDIIDVEDIDGNVQNVGQSNSAYGDDLATQGYVNTGGMYGSLLDVKTAGIIFGFVVTALVSFFGYAYYLKRRREIENV